nr:NADH dehydrogenase [ubiquinone] 1 alpha subcomplex subunit 5 [Halyomorpha halys]
MSLKKSTKLTGLAVCKNPAHVLTLLYGKIIRVLSDMPCSSAYRKYTEEIVSTRAAIVCACTSPDDIERFICCGQAEELILQAEKELLLARNLLLSKPWEPLITKPEPDQWVWPPLAK